MKKIISLVLAIALIMSMTVVAFANKLIPSSYGDENTATENGDWIDSYSFETTWQDAWKEYIEQQGEEVWSGSVSKDAFEDEIVGEVEAGKVSKDTIIGALDSYLETVNGWGAGAKKDTFTAVIGELKEKVNAVETTTPETTTSGDSGGSGGSGGSTDQYTAEEYGKKIVDMLAEGKGVSDIASTVLGDLMGGKIDPASLPEVISYVSENTDASSSDASGVLDFLEGLADQIGGGESIIPGGGDGDISLPDLGSLGDLFSGFDLSSIGSLVSGIPIIGPIIAGLLGIDDGSGDNGGNGGGSNSSDNTWDNGGTDDFSNNDTGDISFIAVGAVALVAGAALILTRKKNEEEE